MSELVTNLRQLFNTLTKEQQNEFLESLNRKVRDQKEFSSFEETILKHKKAALPDRPKCPHCGSMEIVKNGHKDGIQRFRCKECGKTYTYTNETILFSVKKGISTWERYCECLVNKFSLRRSAEECKISLPTAFKWRHKILDALQNMQEDIKVKGLVETDETFLAISYKGAKKSSYKIPREVHKRGHSVSTRGLSKEMVCISLHGRS